MLSQIQTLFITGLLLISNTKLNSFLLPLVSADLLEANVKISRSNRLVPFLSCVLSAYSELIHMLAIEGNELLSCLKTRPFKLIVQ